MKILVTGTFALACLVSNVGLAQTKDVEIGVSYGSGITVPGFLPPAVGHADEIAYWTASLVLNTAQQTAWKAAVAEQDKAMDALTPGLARALAAVRSAARANSSDSEIERLSGDLAVLFSQAVAAQAKAYARICTLLTQEQRQKLETLSATPEGASFSVTRRGARVGGAAKP